MKAGLTTREVSEKLGVSVRTVQTYLKEGKLKAHKDEQGRNIFNPREVEVLHELLQKSVQTEKSGEQLLHAYNPETQIVLDRKAYEELTTKYDSLLIKVGQLEAENRTTQKLLEDFRTRNIIENPVEHVPPQPPVPEVRESQTEEPIEAVQEPPHPHPQHGSPEGTQQLQESWRKFVHAPVNLSPESEIRPFWTAPVQQEKKPWWKRIFRK